VASASITVRKTTRGRPRYTVRYRLGGRAYPVEHGGSFATMREARIRRDLIAGELAAGRNPQDLLRTLTERPKTRTFAQWAEAYRQSRPDNGDETRKNTVSHAANARANRHASRGAPRPRVAGCGHCREPVPHPARQDGDGAAMDRGSRLARVGDLRDLPTRRQNRGAARVTE
jgi:hypothetical protein